MLVHCPSCNTQYECEPGKYECECGAKFSVAANGRVFPDEPVQRKAQTVAQVAPPWQYGGEETDESIEPDIDKTMPGKRTRKTDGRFEIGDLILDRYKVLSELGQGGMGVVYKCFDEIGGIEIALKALPPELSHNTLEMEDIKENFQLVAKLVHQNIAISKNLEKDNATGNYYLIMECVEGEDLRHWIRRKRKEDTLTVEAVLPIVWQVAEALDYAHEEKIIHRDIKPGNIMVDAEGHVKVLDFGLAAQIHTSMTRVSMAYHGTSGTAPYMAPEQWRGQAQGAAADQYALAVMTYEMLAGHLPFESTDVSVLREAVLNDMAGVIGGIPKHVQQTLARGMAKNPDERFNSCSDFAASLEGVKVPGMKKSGKGKWAVLAASIAVLLLVGGGIVWQTQRSKNGIASGSAALLDSNTTEGVTSSPVAVNTPVHIAEKNTLQQPSGTDKPPEPQEIPNIEEDLFAERIENDTELGFKFSGGGRTLLSAPKDITSYDIPNGVAIIGREAFIDCKSLTKITIPNSVNSIGDVAFSRCISLQSITLPNSITSIGTSSFSGCKSLTKITIPDSVSSIGVHAFSDCEKLSDVVMSKGVKTIGISAFRRCKSLRRINIPDGVVNIGSSVFSGCESLRNITIPDSVVSIGENCFEECVSLSSVKLSNKITEINHYLFVNCESLSSIVIPNNVTSIGRSAFFGCTSLRSVDIPQGVTVICERAFVNCKSLSSVKLPDTIKEIKIDDNYVNTDIHGKKMTPFYRTQCEDAVMQEFSRIQKANKKRQ